MPAAPSNKQSHLLDGDENNLVFSLLGPKCITMATTVAQLYFDEKGRWSHQTTGVLCFVRDANYRSFFLRFYNLDERRMIFEQEIYRGMVYHTQYAFFHQFEADDRVVGFNFVDDSNGQDEAHELAEVLKAKVDKMTAAAATVTAKQDLVQPPPKPPRRKQQQQKVAQNDSVHSKAGQVDSSCGQQQQKVAQNDSVHSKAGQVDGSCGQQQQRDSKVDTQASQPPRPQTRNRAGRAAPPLPPPPLLQSLRTSNTPSTEAATPSSGGERNLMSEIRAFRKESLRSFGKPRRMLADSAQPSSSDGRTLQAEIVGFRKENLRSASKSKATAVTPPQPPSLQEELLAKLNSMEVTDEAEMENVDDDSEPDWVD